MMRSPDLPVVLEVAVLALVLASGCGEEAASPLPQAPAEAAAEAAAPAAAEAPGKGKGAQLARTPEPLPEAVAVEGYPAVAILGYGLRMELHPPFQAAVIRPPQEEGEPPPEDPGRLIVSWWDVTARGAGQSGVVGLHNTVIIPGRPQPGAPFTESVEGEGRKLRHRLTQGEGGTVVELPRGASTLGGAMTLSAGPADPSWTVQVGEAEPQPWVEGQLLHSGDPAEAAIYFDGRPQKPWGPWPEVPGPEAASGGEAPSGD